MDNNKLKENLLFFYKNQKNIEVLFNVINKRSNYSLRVIEWFVTNYAKKISVTYNVNGKPFNVYKKYKDALKSYTKEKFDPFKRTKNIKDKFDLYNKYTKETIETTICQLNFFKWLISNNIHEYLDKNINKIKEEMRKKFSIKI